MDIFYLLKYNGSNMSPYSYPKFEPFTTESLYPRFEKIKSLYRIPAPVSDTNARVRAT